MGNSQRGLLTPLGLGGGLVLQGVQGVSIKVLGSRGCDLSSGLGGSPFKLKSSMFLESLGTHARVRGLYKYAHTSHTGMHGPENTCANT